MEIWWREMWCKNQRHCTSSLFSGKIWQNSRTSEIGINSWRLNSTWSKLVSLIMVAEPVMIIYVWNCISCCGSVHLEREYCTYYIHVDVHRAGNLPFVYAFIFIRNCCVANCIDYKLPLYAGTDLDCQWYFLDSCRALHEDF